MSGKGNTPCPLLRRGGDRNVSPLMERGRKGCSVSQLCKKGGERNTPCPLLRSVCKKEGERNTPLPPLTKRGRWKEEGSSIIFFQNPYLLSILDCHWQCEFCSNWKLYQALQSQSLRAR